MDAFNTFIAEAKAKAETYGWGYNKVSLLSPAKELLQVTATQPVPDDEVLFSFRVNGELADRDTVISLLNGE